MYDLHLQAENYTEAGFTLKLYADMLSWSKETLTFAPNDTVGQQEWERKENLYKEVSLIWFTIYFRFACCRSFKMKMMILFFIFTDLEEF